jgi:hypothetical protein
VIYSILTVNFHVLEWKTFPCANINHAHIDNGKSFFLSSSAWFIDAATYFKPRLQSALDSTIRSERVDTLSKLIFVISTFFLHLQFHVLFRPPSVDLSHFTSALFNNQFQWSMWKKFNVWDQFYRESRQRVTGAAVRLVVKCQFQIAWLELKFVCHAGLRGVAKIYAISNLLILNLNIVYLFNAKR